MDTQGFYRAVDYLLILLGVFLILDSFVFKKLYFDYATVRLSWLDQWFNHWMIGIALVLIAWWELKKIDKPGKKK